MTGIAIGMGKKPVVGWMHGCTTADKKNRLTTSNSRGKRDFYEFRQAREEEEKEEEEGEGAIMN